MKVYWKDNDIKLMFVVRLAIASLLNVCADFSYIPIMFSEYINQLNRN